MNELIFTFLMKIKNKFLFLVLLFSSLVVSTQAQFIGTDGFLKGNSIEVGVNTYGMFGSLTVPPPGYHPRCPSTFAGFVEYPENRLGFVADPALDGWTVGTPTYFGDYFIPATPQEGWDIEINGNWNKAWGFNTAFTAEGGPLLLTGSIVSYEEIGREKVIRWEGSMGALSIKKKIIVDTTKTFFIVEVDLENTGPVTLTDIYYGRAVDPDNEERLTSNFSTINEIVHQPYASSDPDDEYKCLVTAKGMSYPALSYLGLGTRDCRAKCFIVKGSVMHFDKSSIVYNDGPTMPDDYVFEVGSGHTGDSGIGLIFDIGDLTPGEKTSLAYAYILRLEDLDTAFRRMVPTLSTEEGEGILHDTMYVCPDTWVDFSLSGGYHYVWSTWFPSTGLADPSAIYENSAYVTEPITYYIVGTNTECPETDTLSLTFIPYNLLDPGKDTTVQFCNIDDTVNLFGYLGGTPSIGGTWTGPGVTPGGDLVLSTMAVGVYEFTYTHGSALCNLSAVLTVEIIPVVDLDFEISYYYGCDQDTIIINNLSTNVDSFKWSFGDGSTNITDFHPTHIYLDQGTYPVWLIAQNIIGCVDSTMRLATIIHSVDAVFTQSNDTICEIAGNTVAFYDASTGDIAEWNWDFGDGATSTLQHPLHTYFEPGIYTIRLVVRDVIGCYDTAYSSLFVAEAPLFDIESSRDEICTGDMIYFTATLDPFTTNMIWDFGDGVGVERIMDTMYHSYTTPGTYYIKVESTYLYCPNTIDYDTILVKPYPVVNLGPDTGICLKGAPIIIDPHTDSGNPPHTKYYWSHGDTISQIKITIPGIYQLIADLDGCITMDELHVHKDCYIDIPNAFTPNGDGDNDYFFPRQLLSDGVVDFNMTIYNRWGEKIFETNDADGRGWDGRYNGYDQPMGVYVYHITVRYKNQASERYIGDVTLVR